VIFVHPHVGSLSLVYQNFVLLAVLVCFRRFLRHINQKELFLGSRQKVFAESWLKRAFLTFLIMVTVVTLSLAFNV